MSGSGRVRHMEREDVPRVGRLFMKVFRGSDRSPSQDLCTYLDDLLFSSPSYTPQSGSTVYEMADGRIGAALLGVPTRIRIGTRQVDGKLMCALMRDPDVPQDVAVTIALGAMRRSRQEFSFNDTASPATMRHFLALGGRALPLSALEWKCPFRPVGMSIARFAERSPPLRRLGVTTLPAPLAGRRRRGVKLERVNRDRKVTDAALSVEDFCEIAPSFIARYAVGPAWEREELRWTLGMAARNLARGPFSLRSVTADGRLIGCFVHYGGRGQIARVLNVLAMPRQEEAVLERMFEHLDGIGCLGAIGRVRSELLGGLSLQPGMVMRHKAFVGAGSRHKDADEALVRGDCYLGGLAGEDWSRLASDFY